MNNYGVTYLSSATNRTYTHTYAYFFSLDNLLHTVHVFQDISIYASVVIVLFSKISIDRGNLSDSTCVDRKLLWSADSSYKSGLLSTTCQRVSWQITTWSGPTTSYFTRQHITKQSAIAMNVSLVSSASDGSQRIANSSSNNRHRIRTMPVGRVVKNDRNFWFETTATSDPVGICNETMVWERTLPTVIYLNRHDVYRFVITFTDNCSEPSTSGLLQETLTSL